MRKNELWEAEKRSLEKILTGIAGFTIQVKDADYDEIGYTDELGAVHLSYKNSLTDAVRPEERPAIHLGVGFHEVLHKLKTNFKLRNKTIKALPRHEASIFAEIDNILEDAAIEEYADEEAGGKALESLKFAIAQTYKKSKPIEVCEYPFGQFISALIMFGDMGVLKGHFTFPEAKDVFRKCAPIFYKGLRSKDTYFRNKCSKEIFEISRPLWQEIAENEKKMQEFLEMLAELMKELDVMPNTGSGRGESSGDGEGSESEDHDGHEESGKGTDKSSSKENKNSRRLTLLIELENDDGVSGGDVSTYNNEKSTDGKEKKGENKTNSSNSDTGEKGESQDGGLPNETKSDSCSSSSSNSGSNSSSSEKGANKINGSNETGKGSEGSEENKENSDSSSSNNSSKSNRGEKVDSGSAEKTDSSQNKNDNLNPGIIDDREFEISKESLESIKSDIEKLMNEDIEEKPPENHDFSIKTMASKKKVSCYNAYVKATNLSTAKEMYHKIVKPMSTGIRTTVNKIRTIFQNDQEERIYKTTGRPNTSRMYGGRITSRIFDREIEPEEKSDFSVFLLIDESGSMHGRKIKAARECAIALTEIFISLNVPIYVMGFTADYKGCDAYHHHYVYWNAPRTKYSLVSIEAYSDNFDGYSIRYATEIVKKSKSLNKLLIVVSDGMPACYAYSGDEGYSDTKTAINDAKKYMNVLGVLIGNSDVNTLHHMYQNDFIHISNTNELFPKIAKKISEMLSE